MSVSVSKQGQVRKKQSILNGTSNGQLLSQIQAQLLKQFQEQELMTQAKSRSGRNTPTETGAVPQTDKQGGGGGLSDKNTGKQLSVVTGKARHSSTRQDNLDCLAALTEVETCVIIIFFSLSLSLSLSRSHSPRGAHAASLSSPSTNPPFSLSLSLTTATSKIC
jgi:hypothetical protein